MFHLRHRLWTPMSPLLQDEEDQRVFLEPRVDRSHPCSPWTLRTTGPELCCWPLAWPLFQGRMQFFRPVVSSSCPLPQLLWGLEHSHKTSSPHSGSIQGWLGLDRRGKGKPLVSPASFSYNCRLHPLPKTKFPQKRMLSDSPITGADLNLLLLILQSTLQHCLLCEVSERT